MSPSHSFAPSAVLVVQAPNLSLVPTAKAWSARWRNSQPSKDLVA